MYKKRILYIYILKRKYVMPKIILNPFRNNLSLAGLTLKHESQLDQDVRTVSTVQFEGVTTHNFRATGNIVLSGEITEVSSTVVKFKDEIIDINSDSTIPLLAGGIRINRGPNLTPFDIIYDETSQMLRIGQSDAMQPVATREEIPHDGYVSVWNAEETRFDARNYFNQPMRFRETVSFDKKHTYGILSGDIAPYISSTDSSGTLELNVVNNIVLGSSNSTAGSTIDIPVNKKLNFSSQYIGTDSLDRLFVDSADLVFSEDLKVHWGNAASFTTENQGSDLVIKGSKITLNSTGSVDIPFGVPFTHASIGKFQPKSGGAYEISSTGNLLLTPGVGYKLILGNFSINDSVTITSDVAGNVSFDATGDIFFNPDKNIVINTLKGIAFSDDTMTVKRSQNSLLLTAADDVQIKSENNGSLSLLGNTKILFSQFSKIYENVTTGDFILSSPSDIQLVPGSDGGISKSIFIPDAVFLKFGAGSHISSTSNQDMTIYSSGKINLGSTSTTAVYLNQNVPMCFGDANHKIYKSSANDIVIDSTHRVIFNATESVYIPIGTLTIGQSTIYQDPVNNSLTLSSAAVPGSLYEPFLQSLQPFKVLDVTAAAGATPLNAGSIVTYGGIYIDKNLIVNSTSVLTGKTTIAGTVTIGSPNAVPIVVSNPAEFDGTSMSLLSQWDSTPGYTFGRGSPTRYSGRALMFTLPAPLTYGVGKEPSFVFGNTTGDYYMTLDSTSAVLSISLKIQSVDENKALEVIGGIEAGKLAVDGDISAATDTFLVSADSVTVKSLLNVYNGLYLTRNNGNENIFTIDYANGADLALDARFGGSLIVEDYCRVRGFMYAEAGFSLTGGNLNLNGNRITNLPDPVNDNDPVNKQYVDGFSRNMSQKIAASAATTEPLNLTMTIFSADDVPLTPGNRVLVKDQVNKIENGIYEVQEDNRLERSRDFEVGMNASGNTIFVTLGTLGGMTGFSVVGSPIIVGTDPINWTPISGVSLILAGQGLTKVGNTFSVNVDNFTVKFDGSNNLTLSDDIFSTIGLTGGSHGVALATSHNQSHVDLLGTITQGTWNADMITMPHGGLGRTFFPPGLILVGNGIDPITTTTDLFFDPSTKYLGVLTSTPSSNLHLVNVPSSGVGTWLRIEDKDPLLSQSTGLTLNSTQHFSRLALQPSGTLYIGQESVGTASKITFATQALTRMTIDSAGSVVVGGQGSTVIAGNVLSVYGKMTVTNDLTCYGILNLPTLKIKQDGSGGAILEANNLIFQSNFQVDSALTVLGNCSLDSTVPGETSIVSVDRVTNLGLPLKFRTSFNDLSAVCVTNGFLVPNFLQIGGVEGDTSTGFALKTINGDLTVTPGIPGKSVLFNAPLSFGEGISLYDKAKPNDPVMLKVQSNSLYIQTAATTTNAPYSFILGGGTNEMITTFTNKAASSYIRYDPTNVSEFGGGVFSISGKVLTVVGDELRLMDIMRFNLANSMEGVVGNSGWYYLGQLGTGRTTMSASLSWRVRLDFDGVSQYSTNILTFDRNVVSLVIYRGTGMNFYIFLQVKSGPCRVSVMESPNRLYFSRYEGGGATPSGEFSGYVSGWVKDLDLTTAQSNSQMQFGGLTVTGTSNFTNATLLGTTDVTGDLNVVGATSSFYNNTNIFYNKTTNLPAVTLSGNPSGGNSIVVSGRNATHPKIHFDRELSKATIGILPSTALTNSGSLTISHEGTDVTSKIVLATKSTPAVIVNDLGNVEMLSTFDSYETETVALRVRGGAIFGKRVVFNDFVSISKLRLTNQSTGNSVLLTADNDSNISLSGSRLTNVGTPVVGTDAVNMSYVQALLQGLSTKDSVIAASNGVNVTFTNNLTVLDGVSLVAGQRVLLKDQTNLVENGIYIVGYNAPLTRSLDMKVGMHAAAFFTFISNGTTNANTGWVCTTALGEDVVGVNTLTFTQFSGAGQFNAGPGLGKVGNTVQLLVDNQSIEISNNNLRIKSTIAGNGLTGGSGEPLSVSSVDHLDSVGTLNRGTWNASIIAMSYGGTGSSNFNVGRIPFSNGTSLTQGSLFFDGVNNRLGINTLTPTSGLTLSDRDIQVNQTVGTSSGILLSSSLTNFSYGIRNDSSNFAISAGSGNNRASLTDIFTLEGNGSLTVASLKATTSFVLQNAYRTSYSSLGATGSAGGAYVLERVTSGPATVNVFSSDATGSSLNLYGASGISTNTVNSEYLSIGYVSNNYTIATKATGTGSYRNIIFQSGANTNQMVLNASTNSVIMNSMVSITNTTSQALTVAGSTVVSGQLTANALQVNDISDNSAKILGLLTVNRQSFTNPNSSQTYHFSVSSAFASDELQISNTGADSSSIVSQYSKNGDNSVNVFYKIFGNGTKSGSSASTEWMQMGYEATSAFYSIRTSQGGVASQRPIILSATPEKNQLYLKTDGTSSFSGALQVAGSVTITETTDATNSTNGGSMTVLGGFAVAKTLVVGSTATFPVTRVTNYSEYSASGSLDKINVKYSDNALHLYNNGSTTLQVHTGNSGGPTSINQEKLVLGYSSTNDHVIKSVATGTGSTTRNLVLTTGANIDQMKLSTDGRVSFSANTIVSVLSTEDVTGILGTSSASATGCAQLYGGLHVSKSMIVKKSVSVGNGIAGALFTLNGSSPWVISSIDVTETSMSCATRNSMFSFKNATGSHLLTMNASGLNENGVETGILTSFSQTIVSTDSAKAFSIRSSGGNDLFNFNTAAHELDLVGGRIVNSGQPLLAYDLVNKQYVDNLVKGLNLKSAVVSSANSNVDLLSPVNSLDDISLSIGNRVLLMNQTNPVENGIWYLNSEKYLIRPDDFLNGKNAGSSFTFVQQGTIRGDKGYVCIADRPNDIIGTNALNFTQFNGNIISAGQGLYKDGNNIMNISLDTIGSGLSFNGGKLRLDPSVAGNGLAMNSGVLSIGSISNLGNVSSGSWQASIIDVAFGGTGNNSFANMGVPYSNGDRLLSSSALLFDGTKIALGINGVPDPLSTGDGLTISNKDLYMRGSMPAIMFSGSIPSGGSIAADLKYDWALRRTHLSPLSTIRTAETISWGNIVESQNANVIIAFGASGNTDAPYKSVDGSNFDPIPYFNDQISRTFADPSMSINGSVMLFPVNGGYVYVSTDLGSTFTVKLSTTTRAWEHSSMSNDGMYMMVSALTSGLYISSDTGSTFTLVTGVPTNVVNLGFVHATKTGSVQFAGYYGGKLFVSRNYGSTFTQDALRTGNFKGMVESQTGTVLAMHEYPGSLFVSQDSGITWTERLTEDGGNKNIVSVSMSTNGSVIAVAVNNGMIYLSTNYGVSFVTIFGTTNRPWTFVKVTSDGKGIIAGGTNINIYVSKDYGATYTLGNSGNVTLLGAEISHVDDVIYAFGPTNLHRYSYNGVSTMSFATGKSTVKTDLSDFVIMTDRKQTGFGYTSLEAGSIGATVDINGSLYVADDVEFAKSLPVSSGGTGTNNFPKGLLLGNDKNAVTSTGTLTDGAVAIGKSDGTIGVESGTTLRSHIGLSIGTNVQAFNARLTEISGLTPLNNYFIKGDGTSFTLANASDMSGTMGLGDLSVLDTVNNTNWLGAALSVANGGTGATTLGNNTVPYYNSSTTKYESSLIYNDATNGGTVINGTISNAGSALTVTGKDVSLQASTSNATPTSILYHNVDATVAWRLYRSDEGSAGLSSFVISGGTPLADKNALTARFTVKSDGIVIIANTSNSTSIATGSLQLSGGLLVSKDIFTPGKLTVTNTTEVSSASVASVVISGGIAVAKSANVYGNLAVTGTGSISSIIESTSTLTGALTVAGGLGVERAIYSGKMIAITGGSYGLTSTLAYLDNITNYATQGLSQKCMLFYNNNGDSHLRSFCGVSVDLNDANVSDFTSAVNSRIPSTSSFTVNARTSSTIIANLFAVKSNGDTLLGLSTSTVTVNGTSDSAISTPGGITCAKLIQSAGMRAAANVNSEIGTYVTNSSTGTAATSAFRLYNSNVTAGAAIFLNSSTKTGDGGVNNLTVRNDIGSTRLLGSASKGLIVDATTGSVTFDDKVVVNSAANSTSSTTGSITTLGGVGIAQDVYIGGTLTVTGILTQTGAVTTPTLVTAAGDLINVSTMTIHSSRLIKVNNQRTLLATLKVTPTAGSLNTQFTVTLPDRTTNFADRLDVNGIVSGFSDDTNLVVLYNNLCTGIVASTKAIVKFQSNGTGIHYVQVSISYVAI